MTTALLVAFIATLLQQNAVANGSFEQVANNAPLGWKQSTWGGSARFDIPKDGRGGGRCVSVSSMEGADAGWSTLVAVKPFSKYQISAWIKTENVKPLHGLGALLNLHTRPEHTEALVGTHDWTRVSMEVDTGADDLLQINCLLGYFGSASGKAWYDDLELKLISTAKLDPAVNIDFSKLGDPISPYIYGQFIEHLGHCINGGIWAEMLADRKLFYAVGEEDSPWKSSDSTKVAMDGDHPFVNGHCASLQPGGSISQQELWLEKGKSYLGYVWLCSGAGFGQAMITLSWGDAPKDSQSVLISKLSHEYAKFPVRFTARSSTKNGRITINSTEGNVRIGCASLMPADNVNGMRRDILGLLRELDSPIYRWPGGNFVSGYNWKDGIGDRDRRPTRKNPAWKGIEPNDFGTDEFLSFCSEIHTEPLIVVNTGLGETQSAVDWIQYVNGTPSSPQGSLRSRNGHNQPYRVKWWGVGNEMFGDWQLGHIPIEQYTQRHNEFAKAMRAQDPNIKLIGSGDVGSNGWSRRLLENCSASMDLISEHFYCQERPGVMAHVAQMPRAIDAKVNAHRDFRKTLPQLKDKDIRIALDEWNYWYGPEVFGELGTRYFLKDALGIAVGLHEMFRNSDIIEMANYAQTVNVIGAIKATPTASSMETTGLVLMLYRKQFGTVPLLLTGNAAPLDVVAATTKDLKDLTVAVVNPTSDQQSLKLGVPLDVQLLTGHSWSLAGKDPQAFNDPGHPPTVKIVGGIALVSKLLTVGPFSVTLYRWPIAGRESSK